MNFNGFRCEAQRPGKANGNMNNSLYATNCWCVDLPSMYSLRYVVGDATLGYVVLFVLGRSGSLLK